MTEELDRHDNFGSRLKSDKRRNISSVSGLERKRPALSVTSPYTSGGRCMGKHRGHRGTRNVLVEKARQVQRANSKKNTLSHSGLNLRKSYRRGWVISKCPCWKRKKTLPKPKIESRKQ